MTKKTPLFLVIGLTSTIMELDLMDMPHTTTKVIQALGLITELSIRINHTLSEEIKVASTRQDSRTITTKYSLK
jgi:hypothetical protein